MKENDGESKTKNDIPTCTLFLKYTHIQSERKKENDRERERQREKRKKKEDRREKRWKRRDKREERRYGETRRRYMERMNMIMIMRKERYIYSFNVDTYVCVYIYEETERGRE